MATPARTSLFSRHRVGGLYVVEDSGVTTGNRWFVDSVNGASTNGGTGPDDALATIDAAVGLCTASQGDIIYVMPGHVETVNAASALDLDVAGIKVIGLGWGQNRPRIQFTTGATSTVEVNADDIWIENLWFSADFTNGITAGLDIKTGADDFTCVNCDFRAEASTKEFLIAVTIEAVNARQRFINCSFWEAAGDATAAIATEGACDDLLIQGCFFDGTYTTAVIDIDAGTNVVVRPKIINNVAYNTDTGAGLFCAIDSGTVGLFIGNRSGIGKANTVPVSDATASVFIDNLATDAAAISELKYPATATAWA